MGKPESKTARHAGALFLSGLVYPGAGQFLQKRCAAAAVTAIVFTACLVWFLFLAFVILRNYYGAADFSRPVSSSQPVAAFLLSFGATLLVYLGNLADVLLAANRRRGRRRQSTSP